MTRFDPPRPSRAGIAIRLLYTVATLLALEICKMLALLAVLVQYALLLITGRHSEPLRSFANSVSFYAYRCLRYANLCENPKPFPFAPLPDEPEKMADTIRFGK
ncbi:MAG: DUF4389 domain-containing protein [Desulfovibrionaceae bacterium]|nr:DUF4389 domain-containing protein [Desulfovibrionaceae bacterium]MBF0514728.1 DUF4389 domain-containing protein [Desulfovibrionaceae bacterium]